MTAKGNLWKVGLRALLMGQSEETEEPLNHSLEPDNSPFQVLCVVRISKGSVGSEDDWNSCQVLALIHFGF